VSGGLVSFGRRLQVAGDLGNAKGPSRASHPHGDPGHGRQIDQDGHPGGKARLVDLMEKLDAHMSAMDRAGSKSPYWAALMREKSARRTGR